MPRSNATVCATASVTTFLVALLVVMPATAAPIPCPPTGPLDLSQDRELASCQQSAVTFTVLESDAQTTLRITDSYLSRLEFEGMTGVTVIIERSNFGIISFRGALSNTNVTVVDGTISGSSSGDHNAAVYFGGVTIADSTMTFRDNTINIAKIASKVGVVSAFLFEGTTVTNAEVHIAGSKATVAAETQAEFLSLRSNANVDASNITMVGVTATLTSDDGCSAFISDGLTLRNGARIAMRDSAVTQKCASVAYGVFIGTSAVKAEPHSEIAMHGLRLQMASDVLCEAVSTHIPGRMLRLIGSDVVTTQDCNRSIILRPDCAPSNKNDKSTVPITFERIHSQFLSSTGVGSAGMIGDFVGVEMNVTGSRGVAVDIPERSPGVWGPSKEVALVHWDSNVVPTGHVTVFGITAKGFTGGVYLSEAMFTSFYNVWLAGELSVLATVDLACSTYNGWRMNSTLLIPDSQKTNPVTLFIWPTKFKDAPYSLVEQERVCPVQTNSATLLPTPTPSEEPTPTLTFPPTGTPSPSLTVSTSTSTTKSCEHFTPSVNPGALQMTKLRDERREGRSLSFNVSITVSFARGGITSEDAGYGDAVEISWGMIERWVVADDARSMGVWLREEEGTLESLPIYKTTLAVLKVKSWMVRCPVGDFQAPIVFQPIRVFVSEEVQRTTESVAIATGAVSGALSNPSSAMLSARAASIMSLTMCDGTAEDPVSITASPLQWTVGPKAGGYFRGTIFGNMALFTYCIAGGGLLALLYYDPRKPGRDTVWGAMGIFHLPGVLCTPIAMLAQGTANAATQLLNYSDLQSDKVLSILALVIMCAFILLLLYITTIGHKAVVTRRESARPDAAMNPIIRFLILIYLSDLKWVDDPKKENSKGFKLHWQQIFYDYRSRRQWYLGFETFISAMVGVLSGIRDPRFCTGVGIAFFLLLAVQCACALTLRPFVAPFETVFHMSISSLTVVSTFIGVLGQLLGSDGAQELGSYMGLLITILASFKMLIDIGDVSRWFYHRYKQHVQRGAAMLLRLHKLRERREQAAAEGIDYEDLFGEPNPDDAEFEVHEKNDFLDDFMRFVDRVRVVLCCTKTDNEQVEALLEEEKAEEANQAAVDVELEESWLPASPHQPPDNVSEDDDYIPISPDRDREENREAVEEEAEVVLPAAIVAEEADEEEVPVESFASLDEALGPATRLDAPPPILQPPPRWPPLPATQEFIVQSNLATLIFTACRRKAEGRAAHQLHGKLERRKFLSDSGILKEANTTF